MRTIVPDNKNIAACGLIVELAVSSWQRNVPDVNQIKRQLGVKSAHVAKKTSLILVLNAPMMSGNASCFPIG